MDPDDFLARSDSYTFFKQLGDLVATGPTGTNVRDLQILLSAPDHKQ
jgi:hydroxypyruvate reductase